MIESIEKSGREARAFSIELASGSFDPGTRSQMARCELGRVVTGILSETLPDELFRWTEEGEFIEFSNGQDSAELLRAAEHEAYWTTHEGLASEVEFNSRLVHVVGELTRAYQQLDLATLQNRYERMLWLESALDSENMISAYETLLVLGSLPVAHLCSDYFMFDPGYMVVDSCMQVLNAKRDRRAATGAQPRPDSEAWYRIYEVLAVLKWKGSDLEANKLLSIEELVSGYLAVEKRCLDYVASHPVPDSDRHSKVLNDLGWVLLQVTKATLRTRPELGRELVAHFNSIHGHVLELEVGHFMRYASTQRVDPWYWDFELFKACTGGPVSDDEANLCYQWRLDAMRRSERKDEVLRSFRLGAKNELEIWTAHAQSTVANTKEARRAS